MTAWSWQPDKQTRAAISRGNRLYREYLKRKKNEYQLALIERLGAYQGFEETK